MLKKVMPLIYLLCGGITVFSCNYDKVDNAPCNTSPDTVSFSGDILPLFRTYCAISGCHVGSAPSGHLNLEDANAYTELSHPGSGYLNTANPTHSILYSMMNSTSQPMPPTGKLNPCRIDLVLKWIQQGAKNN